MRHASRYGGSGIQIAFLSDLRIEAFIFKPPLSRDCRPRTEQARNHWSSAPTCFPAQALNLGTCNMLFHNSNPIIDVLVETKHLSPSSSRPAWRIECDIPPKSSTECEKWLANCPTPLSPSDSAWKSIVVLPLTNHASPAEPVAYFRRGLSFVLALAAADFVLEFGWIAQVFAFSS